MGKRGQGALPRRVPSQRPEEPTVRPSVCNSIRFQTRGEQSDERSHFSAAAGGYDQRLYRLPLQAGALPSAGPAAIEVLNGQDCRQETKLSSVYKKNRLLLQEAANRKLGSNRSVSQIELSDADLLLSIAQLRVQFKSDQSARTDIPSPFASV